MMKKTIIGLTAICLIPQGAAFGGVKTEHASVAVLQPAPKIVLDSSQKTLALEIGENVPDAFESDVPIKKNHGVHVSISGWKESLANGFRNSFKSRYRLAENLGQADLVLHVVRANCEVTPLAALEKQIYMVAAAIHYHAKLLDKRTGTVTHFADTAFSKMPAKIRKTEKMYPPMVQNALEGMFEKIADKMFMD